MMEILLNILTPVVIVGILGIGFGIMLAWFARKFAVKTDPVIQNIEEILPGINCGACGFAGCSGLAEDIAAGEAPVNACPVGGPKAWAEIAKLTGNELDSTEVKKAALVCQGGTNQSRAVAAYQGVKDCRAASSLNISFKACAYGCLSLGTCADVCPFGAIHMDPDSGLPVINWRKCTGCGKCVAECPRKVLKLVTDKEQVYAACMNPGKAREVKQVCSVGCIKCRLCIKVCPVDAISMEEDHIRIDNGTCTLCGQCVEKCPTKCIVRVSRKIAKERSQAVS